jgi:hypothetical protein
MAGASFSQPLGATFVQTGAAGPSGYGKPASRARIRGVGLVVRFSPIKGITPQGALSRKLYLPATLDPFTVDEQSVHNEYDTISGGHFSQPAQGDQNARSFRTMSLDTITVDFDAPYLVAKGQDPLWVRERLYEILRFRKPVHMLVTFNPSRHLGSEFEGDITIREISKDVRNGELETRYLTLTISEWRDPSAARRSVNAGGSRKKGVSLPTTHQLTAKDTLASLSQDFYGSYAFWRDIRDANGISKRFGQKTPIVSLPGRFKVGYKLKIPALGAKLTFPTGASLSV